MKSAFTVMLLSAAQAEDSINLWARGTKCSKTERIGSAFTHIKEGDWT